MTTDNMVLRSVYLDPKTNAELKALAQTSEQPINELIITALEEDPYLQVRRRDTGIGRTLARRAPLALRS